MKNSKIAITAFMALATFSYSGAEEIKVDFDGRAFTIPAFDSGSKQISFETLKENLDENDLPAAIPLKDTPETVVSGINMDYSLMNAINYCEKNGINESITDNLKKLLVYGSEEEKNEFLKPDEYHFPTGFNELRKVDFEDILLLKNKGYEQHCWQDNCRMETVCGRKKSCSRFCELVGATCAVAGAGITSYYTGFTMPTASMAVGAVAALGCEWTCDSWACEDIDDCHEVEKCDSYCNTTWISDDEVDPHTGQIIHS